MKRYLLKEHKVKGEPPEISEISEEELFELLQDRETTRMYAKEDDDVLNTPPDKKGNLIEKPVDETWTGKIVVCMDNVGFESMFEVGIDYYCWDDNGIFNQDAVRCIGVNDMMNQPVVVPKRNFKYKGTS
jgi:hypothetical protein